MAALIIESEKWTEEKELTINFVPLRDITVAIARVVTDKEIKKS